MALLPPPKNWKDIALGRDEKLWTYLMIVMILMMGTLTVGFVQFGDQNPPEEYSQVPTEDFMAYAKAGNETSGAIQTTIQGVPGISLLEGVDANGNGGDIFLVARQWNWTAPMNDSFAQGIQIKMGETYRLHLGSIDVLHGFQLIGSDFLISIQVVPGYDYVVDFIPNETGTFRIICNEYCGVNHHQMLGFLEVVE